MTAIAGVSESGRVWIAGDSCITQDDIQYESASPKVVARDGWVWGCAGDWTAVVVLRDGLEPPPAEKADAGLFVHLAFELLAANGLGDDCAELLFGVNGCLVHANNRHSWHRIPGWQSGRRRKRTTRSWHAIGTGGPYALGCLDAISDTDLTPEQRLSEALTVASRRVSGVRPPWRFVEA